MCVTLGKKIFVHTQNFIRLNTLTAPFFSITARQVSSIGKCRIQHLEVNGLDRDTTPSTFVNWGDLRVQKFSGRQIKLENHKKLALRKATLEGTTVVNHGTWQSKQIKGHVDSIENSQTLIWNNTANLTNDILQNSGVLRFTSLRTAGILKNLGALGVKELRLRGTSRFENSGFFYAQTLCTSKETQFINAAPPKENITPSCCLIEVLQAMGAVSNFGEMSIGCSLDTLDLLKNDGVLTLQTGSLSIEVGENRNTIDVPELHVKIAFLNIRTTAESVLRTSSFKGPGTFENRGYVLGVSETLLVGIKKLINGGRIYSCFLRALSMCQNFINKEDGILNIDEGGVFEKGTSFENKGQLQMKGLFLCLLGGSSNEGTIYSSGSLELEGAEFINEGQISIVRELTLRTRHFTNRGLLEVGAFWGKKPLKSLMNQGEIEVRSGKFKLEDEIILTNKGTLKGADIKISGSTFHQEGTLKGKTLTLVNTLFITADNQTTTLKKCWIHQCNCLRFLGSFHIDDFAYDGMLNLLGHFHCAYFIANVRFHNGAKLKGQHCNMGASSILEEGAEINADYIYSTGLLTVQGLMLVRNECRLNSIKIGPMGQLQGYAGLPLTVILKKDSEVAGLLDTDKLQSKASLCVKEEGRLLVRKETQSEGRLTINHAATAVLREFSSETGTICNYGHLILTGLSSRLDLANFCGGKAFLDGRLGDQLSSQPSSGAVQIKIKNFTGGELKFKNGVFDAQEDQDFVNAGILIQDENASLLWTSTPQQKVNTGQWITLYPTRLTLGSIKEIGKMKIKDSLQVEVKNFSGSSVNVITTATDVGTRQVSEMDAILILDLLLAAQVETSLVDIHARAATVVSEKKYPWRIRMTIDLFKVDSTLCAPAWDVSAITYSSAGGNFGKFVATNEDIKLRVADIENTNGRIHGKSRVHIKFSTVFQNGARLAIPGGGNGSLLYKRNDSGISSGGGIVIEQDRGIKNLGFCNNYGVILAFGGTVFISTTGTLCNTAGLIYAEGISITGRASVIEAERIHIGHDAPYAWAEGGLFLDAKQYGKKKKTQSCWYQSWEQRNSQMRLVWLSLWSKRMALEFASTTVTFL